MSEETLVEESTEICERRSAKWRRVLLGGLAAVVLVLILHLAGALHGLEQSAVEKLPKRPADALLNIVNVFTCCILSWKALTTMLPAFLLGGAITAFVPTTVVLRYLGSGTNQVRAYAVAAISGISLGLCSCNIVPLFVSIYRRGAGIGPAFTFLFAGPAINVVAMIFTVQVIGWRLGLWRAIGVPIIAVLTGLCMSFLFRHEAAEHAAKHAQTALRSAEDDEPHGRIWLLFAFLLAMVVTGASNLAWPPKIIVMATLAALAAAHVARAFSREEATGWLREAWALVKLVVPVLLPAILVIGAIAAYIDVKLVYRLVGPAGEHGGAWDTVRPILTADLFGAFMYFPVLAEVAFTKAFLKLGMDIGPALALMITGPGLSLPGLFIISRAVGWRKALVYEGLVVAFTLIFALLFASAFGKYICECMMLGK